MNISTLEKVAEEIRRRKAEHWERMERASMVHKIAHAAVMMELQSLGEWVDGLIADQENLDRERAADGD